MNRSISSMPEPDEPSAASAEAVEAVAKRVRPDADDLAIWFDDYVANHRRRVAFDVDLLLRHVRPGLKVLEMGSVPLLFTGAAARLGHDIVGVDLAPERFRSAVDSLGLQVTRCDIEQEPLPFPGRTFDAVLFFELFEHLRIDPIFTLKQVLRVMKPGAVMLLSTPNLKSLRGVINFLRYDKAYSCCGEPYQEYSKLQNLGHMGHVREYTVTEVCTFLSRIGLEPRQVVYRGKFHPIWMRVAVRLLARLRPFFTVVAARPG